MKIKKKPIKIAFTMLFLSPIASHALTPPLYEDPAVKKYETCISNAQNKYLTNKSNSINLFDFESSNLKIDLDKNLRDNEATFNYEFAKIKNHYSYKNNKEISFHNKQIQDLISKRESYLLSSNSEKLTNTSKDNYISKINSEINEIKNTIEKKNTINKTLEKNDLDKLRNKLDISQIQKNFDTKHKETVKQFESRNSTIESTYSKDIKNCGYSPNSNYRPVPPLPIKPPITGGVTPLPYQPQPINPPITGGVTPLPYQPQPINPPITGGVTPLPYQPQPIKPPITGGDRPVPPLPIKPPITGGVTPLPYQPQPINPPITGGVTPLPYQPQPINPPITGGVTPLPKTFGLTVEPINKK